MSKKDIALMINGFTTGILLYHSDLNIIYKIIIGVIMGISVVSYRYLKDE